MNAVDCIRMNLDMATTMTIPLIDDMKDVCCTAPTPNGGNHPLWVLGHLAYSEASMLEDIMLGEGNPLADWKPIFGDGSEPTGNTDDYPPFDEVRAKFDEVRARTVNFVEGLSDADLDTKSKNSPAEWEAYFGTWGKCLTIIAAHAFMHHGQVADARRAAGRAPNM